MSFEDRRRPHQGFSAHVSNEMLTLRGQQTWYGFYSTHLYKFLLIFVALSASLRISSISAMPRREFSAHGMCNDTLSVCNEIIRVLDSVLISSTRE